MISFIQQLSLSCGGNIIFGCGKTPISIQCDMARYTLGNSPNAEEHQKLYVREMHKKLETKGKKAGLFKIDTNYAFSGWADLNQYQPQHIYNYQFSHLCNECMAKQINTYELLKKNIAAAQKKLKQKKTKITTNIKEVQ
jgi:hypothetical protein